MSVIEALLKARRERSYDPRFLPDVVTHLTARHGGCSPSRMAQYYEVPTLDRAEEMRTRDAKMDILSWAGLFVEEVGAVIHCATLFQQGKVYDHSDLRVQLQRAALLLLDWLEDLDARQKPAEGHEKSPRQQVEQILGVALDDVRWAELQEVLNPDPDRP